MPDFDATIIGGGLGGLVAGAILAKKGKKVLLLEQHYVAGGCATSFKRKDFLMEVGLHEISGLNKDDKKLNLFNTLNIDDKVTFLKVPEFYRFIKGNLDYLFPHGYTESLDKLIEKYPEEKKGLTKFFRLIHGVKKEISRFPTSHLKYLLILPIIPFLFPHLAMATRYSVGKWLDKNINNEELKTVLMANLAYYHDDPYSMSLIFYSAGQAGYISGGGYFVKGGSQKLSDSLVQIIRENGSQVLLGKKVEEIATHKGRVSGVVFRDSYNQTVSKTLVRSDIVIANAAIPNVANLLPKPYREKLQLKTKKMEVACSICSVYIGFKKEVKTLGNKNYSTFVSHGMDTIKQFKSKVYDKWETRPFVFVDYSQIESELAPDGKSFGTICALDNISEWENLTKVEYANRKKEVARLLFKRLEELIPGISSEIECYSVSTPKTIKKYTSNPQGTAYGFAQIPVQAGKNRMKNMSPVKGLYFSSAWAFPGGGFTGAIKSGTICAKNVLKSSRLNGKKSLNGLVDDERIVCLYEKSTNADEHLVLDFEKPELFDFRVGQYVVLSLHQADKLKLDLPQRSLRIYSEPGEKNIKLILKETSTSFRKACEKMEAGDAVTIFGPMGN